MLHLSIASCSPHTCCSIYLTPVTILLSNTTITLYTSNLVLCYLRPNRPVWPVTLGLTGQLSRLFRDKRLRCYFAIGLRNGQILVPGLCLAVASEYEDADHLAWTSLCSTARRNLSRYELIFYFVRSLTACSRRPFINCVYKRWLIFKMLRHFQVPSKSSNPCMRGPTCSSSVRLSTVTRTSPCFSSLRSSYRDRDGHASFKARTASCTRGVQPSFRTFSACHIPFSCSDSLRFINHPRKWHAVRDDGSGDDLYAVSRVTTSIYLRHHFLALHPPSLAGTWTRLLLPLT